MPRVGVVPIAMPLRAPVANVGRFWARRFVASGLSIFSGEEAVADDKLLFFINFKVMSLDVVRSKVANDGLNRCYT